MRSGWVTVASAPSCVLLFVGGCIAATGETGTDDVETLGSALSREQREERIERIRDVAGARRFSNYWLLAAVAKCETELAHCWSEATWACQGPSSPDCGGGPVIAGSGDGACSLRRGGLGLFQFDAGTHNDTLRREGDGILTLDGNIDAAVSYITQTIIDSRYVPGVSSDAQAREWAAGVRVGTASYANWIRTVTGYYNGCFEGACSAYASRYARYDRCHRALLADHGESFFFADTPADDPGDPAPSCGDRFCGAGETCSSCATDCGACPASCGDRSCNGGETCSSCPSDCGACPASCGDRSCNGGESCSSCPGDCGACAARCGDRSCSGGETCASCPGDCGACAARCGDGSCNGTETCSSCAGDCGACPAPACSVPGHGSTAEDGGSCSTDEAWRCVYSASFGTTVSQVCRDGRWLNFHLSPRDCDGCCGAYSTDCRQSGV